MKIIKDGSSDKIQRVRTFACDFCGCVFEADKDEYLHGYDRDYGEYYAAQCPNCRRRVVTK